MCKIVRNKRAITPVLSNVLMMLIAVAGMSIALAASYVITTNLHDIMGERLTVEDVWFRDVEISIYLRNTGKVPIQLAAVYINYTAQSFTPLKLDVQSHGWLNITYSWAPNLVYHIKVVTNGGTQIANYYMSPA